MELLLLNKITRMIAEWPELYVYMWLPYLHTAVIIHERSKLIQC